MCLFTVMPIFLALSACGKQAFKVVESQTAPQSPGNYTIAPKVDILLVSDDTGSAFEAFKTMNAESAKFVKQLDQQNWNYHFAVVPLTHVRAYTQVMASKQDPNWGSEWIAPFPGADISTVPAVSASAFRKVPANPLSPAAGEFSELLNIGDVNGNTAADEFGLETLVQNVGHSTSTGFRREDALLVILLISNGQDISNVPLCLRNDGVKIPCSGNWNSGVSAYATQLTAAAQLVGSSNPAVVRFFAGVSAQDTGNCIGGNAWAGTRYMTMASLLSGQSFDLCSQSFSGVFSSLASALQGERKFYRTRYLFMDKEPNPATIVVTKYPGATVIPQSAVNGWTYEGKVNGVFAIDAPIPMNQSSGFALELHGSAKLVGDEYAIIEFKPAGAKDSVAQ